MDYQVMIFGEDIRDRELHTHTEYVDRALHICKCLRLMGIRAYVFASKSAGIRKTYPSGRRL